MKSIQLFPVLCAVLLCAALARAQSHAYGVGEASFQNSATITVATATATAIGSVTLAINPRSSGAEPVICWGSIGWQNTSAATETVIAFSSLGLGTGAATIAPGAYGCVPFEQDGSFAPASSPMTVSLQLATTGAGSINPQLAGLICAGFPQ
ncbi:MAG: hypothetical protein ACHP7H_01305 [Hyphomicrobiales bacterium]